MSDVRAEEISEADAGLRLDRWFKRHFPQLTHGRLQKLLRTGQVRVDGKRIKAGFRLEAGQHIRVPPLSADEGEPGQDKAMKVSAADAGAVRSMVLYRDDHVIVLNKPPGLAVQGGTKTARHLDGMLDALRFGSDERPRLVHRLDKDTSGVLLLARNAASAAKLAAAFKSKTARKLYWAAVVGVPHPPEGRINLPLAKISGAKGERMMTGSSEGKAAETLYRVVEHIGKKAAWLVLAPLTGRTHQLRAHCAALGTPILGDGKYGGAAAFFAGDEASGKPHLHARSICIPHPNGGVLEVVAPLPVHMKETWRCLGFSSDDEADKQAADGLKNL